MFPLHGRGINFDVERGKTRKGDFQKIVQSRAVRRSHQPDARGQKRNRLFARFVEQPFGGQALFQKLELPLEFAQPQRAQTADRKLIFAARHVDGEFSVSLDPGALGDLELRTLVRAAEVDRLDLRGGVLERHVGVAAPVQRQIADLAADPHRAERTFHDLTHDPVEFAYAENMFLFRHVTRLPLRRPARR